MAVGVLVVDDHVVVREGMKALLGTQPEIVVVGEAATSHEALSLFVSLEPDVTLLDLCLPGVRGTELLGGLLRAWPAGRIIVVTVHGGEAEVRSALDAGARGYLLKDAPREQLFAAIRAVADGRVFVTPEIAALLVASRHLERLTEREAQVLELVASGKSNDEIACALTVSVGTVKTHVHNVLEKLGARDRMAAVAVALERGLIRRH